MSLRQGVRADMQRVLDRLESQVQRVVDGRGDATMPAADATDFAMRAMTALACTIPPYPEWMERDDDDVVAFLQPVSLASAFRDATSDTKNTPNSIQI